MIDRYTDPADAIRGLGARQWDILVDLVNCGSDESKTADNLPGGTAEKNVASLKTLHRRGLVKRVDGGLPRDPVSTWTTKWQATERAREALESYI